MTKQHPIKFRAFANGKMREVRAISFTETGEVHRILDAEGVQRVPEALLQFSGLHDKNGTEIYEGNELKLAEGDDGSLYVCVVCWNDETAAFACRKLNDPKPYSDHMYGANLAEVIGDIYQNPELLK